MRIMHVIVAAALLGGASLGAAPALAGSPEGVWRTPKGWHIKLHRCGASLCGTVVGGTNARDAKNPDPKLRQRKMVGVRLLWGLKPAGSNSWRGKLYNPNDGKTYTGQLSLVAPDRLKLSGCVLGGLICKSQTWQRLR